MQTQPYDLIGDIHGQHDKLILLLTKLGYQPRGQGFQHTKGRKIIFLGDYIDRGPKVREVLRTVRTMVEAGDALALMGNHEYNAICYHTPDGQGDWLRAHRWDRDSGLLVTLAQFAGLEDEWRQWLEWMRHLPLFLDLGNLRAVHACWDSKRIQRIQGKSLTDDAFLHASAKRGTATFRAVYHVLKGPEMDIPEGQFLHDKDGCMRQRVRVRWWNVPEKATVGELALPEPYDHEGEATPLQMRRLPNYGPTEPPVFFGHYWLPAERSKAPLAPNIGCLDFSAAREGPLVAYRWDGEQRLAADKYVTANL